MVFRKHRPDAPPGFFACEAAGLRWLAAADGPRVVGVLDVGEQHLDLEHLRSTRPDRGAAERLGRDLAGLHDAGASAFGAPPSGWDGDGFFGPLDEPLPLRSGSYERWGPFYADCRLDQVRDLLRARGRLGPRMAEDLHRVTDRVRSGDWDDEEPPARVHGDLWSGNVMWTSDGAVLIDPAAHGGHRMTDLAMLELFGLPHLDEVLTAYRSVHPLPDRWAEHVAVHQLYPLGMHAVLFGGGYVGQFARSVARLV